MMIKRKLPKLDYEDGVSEIIECLNSEGLVLVNNVPNSKTKCFDYLQSMFEIKPQYNGELIWDVVPKFEGDPTSVGNGFVPLHTELSEFEDTPSFMALYCVTPAAQGGELSLVNCKDLLKNIPVETLKLLENNPMKFECDSAIAEVSVDAVEVFAPILKKIDGKYVLRYDEVFHNKNTPEVIILFQKMLSEYQVRNEVKIKQLENQLLIWDNRIVLHGREAFSDSNRELWRFCLELKFEYKLR